MSDRMAGILEGLSDVASALVARGVPESTAVKIASGDLPMDQASRSARASAQGYDLNAPQFHGTSSDFNDMRPSTLGNLGPGFYTTPDPDYANSRSMVAKFKNGANINAGQNVIPMVSRQGNYLELNQGHVPNQYATQDAQQNLIDMGYDGIKRSVGDDLIETNTFDPANIRSLFAAFDPEQRVSRNMLASGAGLGILGAGMFGSGQAKADVGSITPEEPGYRDRFEQGLGELFGGDREDHRRARNFTGILDFIPGVGDIAGAADTIDSYREDDYLGTGINGLATLLGAAPIVGPGLAKAVKNSKPSVKSALDQVDGILDGFTARQQPRQIETNFSTENVTDKKYLEPILDDLKVDAQRIQYDKPEIYLPDYYGKNAVITMVDRSPTNSQIFGVNGVEFKTPQQIGGGRDYMFDNENYPGMVFANDSGASQAIINRRNDLSVDPENPDDMLLIPMEMATTSVDFPDFAPGLHMRYAQVAMSNKDKKYVNSLIKKGGDGNLSPNLDPTAVPKFDIDMPNIDEFLQGLTGPQRKTINNVFNMVNKPTPAQKKKGARYVEGALSNDEMRAAVSDPDLYNQKSLLQTNNVGVLTGGKFPSNHNTYNTGVGGEGLGVLNIPRDTPATAPDFLPDLFPNSTPGFVDPSEAFTARKGVRTAEINDGLLKRLGY
tara:strand:+ start:24 stop:2021 length:1998 start_codon:yes stop_codon:yes gene_type:complete